MTNSIKTFFMKATRRRKIRLVTAASHFVVSWFLLLDFKCRYVVSGYRFDIAMSFRPSIIPLSALWFVVVSFRFFSVPFRRVIPVPSLRRFVASFCI